MRLVIKKNSNIEEYEKITQAVKDNNGYCPCLIEMNENTKCICKDFKEQDFEGSCHCGRYLKQYEL
jgi:hypothetical protein